MSDQKTPSAGEPVDEPGSVDDVVGRANEGLAEAEAAKRDAAEREALARDDLAREDEVIAARETVVTERTGDGTPVTETVVAEEVSSPVRDTASSSNDDVPWYDRPESVPMDPEPAPAGAAYASDSSRAADRTAAVEERPTERVPVAETAYAAPQPIFVQAPEAPRPLGNRGAVGAIGLLAALAFAVLSFAIIFGYGFLTGAVDPASAATDALEIISNAVFWVPVIVFYLAFWLLGAVLNRARWAHWVIWGLLVGVASYGGYLLGVLFAAPFWDLTARQGRELLEGQLFSPLAILAFVLGRELTIWFGAWAAKRAGRITELNEQAQREYERTLEAGPQLVRA
ncbi:ABC transporter [Microbacterium sp. cx-55]|uniref:ABC transporter n=1 Tax=Microbacterium sp. cx-55 TaxID=2875948 RepID=UPI001CBAAA4A|nr:ABC transporter [Microbacterium sp. cx-55]MBZ4487610.1 ABC transporter [Microbacterium sp. cx-55]UGB35624.1 ABC transporter [Microbacterium sp. cx-55]